MSNSNVISSEISVISRSNFMGQEVDVYGTAEEPLFLAKDVAAWIEHSDAHKMVASVDEDEKVRNIVPTLGGPQEMWMLTEDGLYEVLMQSRKPIAKQFKKGVKEILKTIRRTGEFKSQPQQPKSQQEKNQILTAKMKVASWAIKTLNMNEASKLAIVKSIADPLGLPTPDYVESKGAHLSAKDLLAKHDAGISSIKFNDTLVKLGYLTTVTRKAAGGKDKSFKVITEKGAAYGENMVSPHNQSETQPHWYIDKFAELLEIVKKAMSEGKEESHD